MDEVFIRIQGALHYLWRAVDQDGVVLDILVQERRDARAAKRFSTDRRGDENGRCNGSNHLVRRNTSSRLTRSSMATSIHGDT
jgi:hypothetical protein